MAPDDDDEHDDDESGPDPLDAAPDAVSVDADVESVRAALDDEDLLEPDVFDKDEDDAVVAEPRKKRRFGIAPALVLLGAGAWAVAMAARCSPLPPGDGLAVTPSGDEVQGDPASSTDERPAPASDRQSPRSEGPDADEQTPPDEEEAEQEPEPVAPEDWAKDVTAPSVVTYKVRHGGSIKNVANLFKIFHHEIEALNPGVGLDKELPPGSAVTVYRAGDGVVSESIGTPSGGTLAGGVPMVDGPGRVLKMIPWKGWGTANTVATLDRVLRRWGADESNEQPILVGNMSARDGGRLDPHSTHQSGRDVDLGYLQKPLADGEELNWREMTADNLDPEATWKLFQLLRATGQLEAIFADSKIQKVLYDWAIRDGMSKSSLRRWMEYPRTPPIRGAIIQHVPGHTDHLHVRFHCTADEKRCVTRSR